MFRKATSSKVLESIAKDILHKRAVSQKIPLVPFRIIFTCSFCPQCTEQRGSRTTTELSECRTSLKLPATTSPTASRSAAVHRQGSAGQPSPGRRHHATRGRGGGVSSARLCAIRWRWACDSRNCSCSSYAPCAAAHRSRCRRTPARGGKAREVKAHRNAVSDVRSR